MPIQEISAQRLREAVRGIDITLPRGEAMARFAASAEPDKAQVLAEVLENTAEHPTMRASAAIALGRILSPTAEQLLVQSLAVVDPNVLPEVLRSLGQIGGPGALQLIQAAGAAATGRALEAARFAAELIAHRFNLDAPGRPLPPPEQLLPIPNKPVRPIRLAPSSAATRRRIGFDLDQYPYGIGFSSRLMYDVDCGGNLSVLCMNRLLDEPQSVARLFTRKALAGVIALRSPETGAHAVSFLLLTRPGRAPGTLEIVMPRCSGVIALIGSAERTDSGFEFWLRAVRRPGAAAIQVTGALEASGIVLGAAVSSLVREPSRRPAYLP